MPPSGAEPAHRNDIATQSQNQSQTQSQRITDTVEMAARSDDDSIPLMLPGKQAHGCLAVSRRSC